MPKIILPNEFDARWYQQDLMGYFDAGGLRACEVWSRRAGKDMTMVHQAAKAAMRRVGLYLHTLPSHKQARKVVWDNIDNDGKPLLKTAFPDAIVKSRNETEMKVTFINGSIWQLVGADYFDSIVGANPVGLTMSEAALTAPSAWDYFRPILAANGGWAGFIGTPRGKNWFWNLLKLAKKPGSNWHWSHLPVDVLKHIPAHILAQEREEMADELYRQEYDCDFSAANVGAIFGRWMEDAERQGRVTDDVPEPQPFEELIVSSDIGRRDKAAFWWWRVLRGGFELVDYDEASGLDAEEWCERLRGKPRARILWLPHDAKVKTFATRKSVIETFLESSVADDVRINPVTFKKDQINAGRRILRHCRFRETACAKGLEALWDYHYKWDEEQKIFSQEPDHNWASHAADAFMGGAQVLEDFVPKAPPPPPQQQLATPHHHAYTLDDLWQTVGPRAGRGRV